MRPGRSRGPRPGPLPPAAAPGLTAPAAALAVLAVLAPAVAVPAACGHGPAAPADAVRAYATAVTRGDWERAYAHMSEGYRRQVPPDRFRSELEADRETAAGDAAALARESGDRPVRAVVETARGDRISLILERGEWKLEEQPLAPYRQDTPRAAVRTYVRAVSERRYDVVLRLVPARRRAEVTLRALRAYWEGPGSETRLRALESLRAGLEGPIVETGAEARMPYGQDGMVRFLREDGVWKIADME